MKFTLQRVRLNAQGYTSRGHYYGVGLPLWWATNDHNYDEFFRAASRAKAKEYVRKTHADATFYR